MVLDLVGQQRTALEAPGLSTAELFGFPSDDDVKAKAAEVRTIQYEGLNAQIAADGRTPKPRRLGPDGGIDGEDVKVQ